MARRGFFAEIQHQSRVAARERERAEREAVRRYNTAVQQAEQAKKESERARTQFAKAAVSERKRLEKEAREAHVAAMEAEVIERNEKLERIYEEIDSLLTSTLGVDDYVDLSSLRVEVTHPPFDRPDLEVPLPQPSRILLPNEPVLVLPELPSGLASFFGKKKYAEAVENAQRAHERDLMGWRAACRDVLVRNQKAEDMHTRDEARRLDALRSERERYAKECAVLESEAADRNRRLDDLVTNLGYGTADAIQEYISIVLSNSVYPDHFQVAHEFEFDPSAAELRLRVLVPGPGEIPVIKSYKYTKAADEITSTPLSQKECRDRYAGAIHQVALRSFHEVFESDRRGLIKTISLEVGTNAIDPATGNRTYMPFVIAAAERESFLTFELSAVVPALTLGRLGAAVSKNPYSLVVAERSGVRRS
jgi:restriction system protein